MSQGSSDRFTRNPRRYRMMFDRIIRGRVIARAGDVVYHAKRYDYGLANDDARVTGEEHIAVSLRADGGYPLFTVPVACLVQLPEQSQCCSKRPALAVVRSARARSTASDAAAST